MEKVNLPDMQKGDWVIKSVVTERVDWSAFTHGRAVPLGEKITTLTRHGDCIMSDTPSEMWDHEYALRMATGSCLLNGLGIGMLLKNILLKPDVTDVTVVEISQDLIDLVASHYTDPRVTIVCADAFEYKIPKGKRYNMVWHDIWDAICADNLTEMTKLHRKYGRHTDWQGSWAKYECQRHQREWSRQERQMRWFSH